MNIISSTPGMTLKKAGMIVKKVSLLTGLFLGLAASAGAQERADLDMTARIIDEGLHRSEALAMYTHLTDVIGPRLAGTPAFKRAADWAVARLDGWGLDDVHLESWEFGRGWTLEGFTLEMTEPRYFPLVGYPEAWTPSTDGEILGTPVYVGDKTAEEIESSAPRSMSATRPPRRSWPWAPD